MSVFIRINLTVRGTYAEVISFHLAIHEGERLLPAGLPEVLQRSRCLSWTSSFRYAISGECVREQAQAAGRVASLSGMHLL
jgi:hypothetical protein